MNASAVIDQALETLLKARIASISPYLLLESRSLGGKAAQTDTPFADFTTVGGGSLFRLHNTVYSPRLSSTFDDFLKEIRDRRNVIMHQPSSAGQLALERFSRMSIGPTDIYSPANGGSMRVGSSSTTR